MCIRDRFKAVLFPDKAPQAYDNFAGLVQAGYYNGPVSYTHLDVYKRQNSFTAFSVEMPNFPSAFSSPYHVQASRTPLSLSCLLYTSRCV